ncbi:MAG: tRNA (N6-threonylcarbamoyladenosine(37)-N6)-methyltransferase TrmO [Syntrophales bacterium]
MEIMNGENWRKELILRPVGVVRSALKAPLKRGVDDTAKLQEQGEEIRKQMRQIEALVSELAIDPGLEGLLDGIEEFSHIVVLYWPHLLAEEKRTLVHVHPMGLKEFPETGIFATRSPARPNPVLVSTAELLERDGNVLRVKGLEAVDGSPIIDIKPYAGIYPEIKEPRFPEWLRFVFKLRACPPIT